MQNDDNIRKWLKGELSDSELKESVGTDEFARITRLMDAVSNFKAPAYDAENEYRRLSERKPKPGRTIPLYQRVSPAIRIAAVLVIAFVIGYFIYNQSGQSQQSEWIADQSSIYLPDSSLVRLNAGSKIRYASNDWSTRRDVELEGEAYFRVRKGSQFNVKTSQGTVSVLGTEFAVNDRKNYYEVVCYSGSVRVTTPDKSIVLEPNAAFRIIQKQEETYQPDKTEPDWLSGESTFKSVPFQYVIDELERQYNVSVDVQHVDMDQMFTGRFSHQNLELALKAITIPVNLNYTVNGNKIRMTVESN